MRPIKLSMTAFGPFSKTEIIEFDKLGDNPLFLINGPTGSGKTTILDAICFALYGSTTGNERDAKQMRCDQAAPDILTEVELVFALNDQKYRITRQPEQDKPKARGEGFTNHGATAELQKVGANGSEQLLVARKVGEANDEVQRLTGLNAEQFRQVMVLPQGKFRELLMANSRDRESIFSQLFQTHIYKRIEDQLKDRASVIRKDVEAQRNQQKGILEASDVDNSEALDTELEQLKPEHAKCKLVKEQAVGLYQQANDNLNAAQTLAADFTRLEQSRARQISLQERKPAIDKKRQEQAFTEEANRLNPQFSEVKRCANRLSDATQKWQQAQADHASKLDLFNQATAAQAHCVEHDEPQLDKVKQQLSTLTSYRQRVTQLENAQQRKQQASKVLEHAETQLHSAQARAKGAKDKIAQAEGELKQIVLSLNEVADIRLTLKTQSDQLSLKNEQILLGQKIQSAQLNLSNQQSIVEEAVKAFDDHQKSVTQIEIVWHRGQAALLAEKLEDEQPCAVCGSTEHPNPAISLEDIPSEDDVNNARAQANQARDQVNKVTQGLETIKTDLAHLKAQLSSTEQKLGSVAVIGLTDLQAQYDLSSKKAEQLTLQQQRQVELTQQLEQHKHTELDTSNALELINTQLSEAKAALATSVQALQNAEQELPDSYRSLKALEDAIVDAEQSREALSRLIKKTHDDQRNATAENKAAETRLHDAEQSKNELSEAYEKALEGWQDTLHESSFADEKQFELALSAEAKLAELKAEIRDYDTQCDQIQGAIKEQENALKGKSQPELDVLKRTLAEQANAREVAEAAFQETDKRFSRLKDTRDKLDSALATTADLESRYALIGTLADVANGNTGNKISLQRFVLSVLLDDVLLVASTRLKKMSKGRYQLFRNQDKAKGGGASGLDLVVEDAYTGNQRPVATLSGGESFIAALSLALGLSDIVQAYAGGIRLDTLFIDEGFGSLDPESLDLAINTLVDLRATGRMVGIISHVPELKEWINVRLDVVADRSGSRTVAVLP